MSDTPMSPVLAAIIGEAKRTAPRQYESRTASLTSPTNAGPFAYGPGDPPGLQRKDPTIPLCSANGLTEQPEGERSGLRLVVDNGSAKIAASIPPDEPSGAA